jgi:DNA polymerase-3 subunit delta'
MGFETLLGNDRLKDNLTASLRQGKTAHFYLISGPAGSGKGKLARLLSAAAMCQGEDKPCCRCAHCRKVLSGVHPQPTVLLAFSHDPPTLLRIPSMGSKETLTAHCSLLS